MKAKIIIISLLLGMFVGTVFAKIYPQMLSFEEKREKILNDMEDVIKEQGTAGNYRCCIEPACTMCFMGNWIWDDGICGCDDMIAQGETDKVCPQCVRGLEEGLCKYSEKEKCET